MLSDSSSDLLSELSWRGLLHQVTHETELKEHLAASPRKLYVGFDPTADSLTIGNLVPIMLLLHAKRSGHIPVVVMGGGTGLIGDPSGKSSERMLLDEAQVEKNIHRQRRIFDRLFDFSSKGHAILLNNADWLKRISYIELLRDVGKHFSINAMIQRDSVRDRLHGREQGISYTEFSYMILQAYDFYHLCKEHEITLQMGGSDQFGNIVSGCDLIRRLLPKQSAYGLTAPLLTKADGGKFGKTETGAIWLTPDRTSPYHFYQFFLNTDDRDIIKFLKLFTFLTKEEIDALAEAHEKNPGARMAHRTLAQNVTDLLHGKNARLQAEAASEALFSGDITQLDRETFQDLFQNVPSSQYPLSLLSEEGLPMAELLILTNLVQSKREAREHLSKGAILVNGQKVQAEVRMTQGHLLHGSILAIRKGRKHWYVLRFL